MRTRLAHVWEILTSSYWFVPGAMVVVAVLGATLLLALDQRSAGSHGFMPAWLYGGGAEGARAVLTVVGGSVITVAGVVFSITIAAITQASSQFGPRILRKFMRDRGNQIVLGTFVSTFLYCLLVIRSVRGDGSGEDFVPQLSVSVGVGLAIVSIAVLIYFIHHVSVSLQAPVVVAEVSRELQRSIVRLATPDPAPVNRERPADPDPTPLTIRAPRDGYIQAVDRESLVDLGAARDLFISLDRRPGHYVSRHDPVARVWPLPHAAEQPGISRSCAEAFIIGQQRTPEQDVEFGIHQIVELAVRALSPSINDPFTAMNCVDALGSGLSRVSRVGLPASVARDDAGIARLRLPDTTYADLTDAALNQIRQHASRSHATLLRLLEMIAAVAIQATAPDQRAALRRHADMIERAGRRACTEENDLADLRKRYHDAIKALSREPDSRPGD